MAGSWGFNFPISGATKCTVAKTLVKRKSSNWTILKARDKMAPEMESKSRRKALLCREEGRKNNKRKFPDRKGKTCNPEKRIFLVKMGKVLIE